MIRFIKPNKINYIEDSFYQEVSSIIGMETPYLKGTYLRYGKNKACDMDITEDRVGFNQEKFINYINKLIKNKDKYYLLEVRFNEPYEKLQIIRDKLGYLDGMFIKHSNDSIINDVENLPIELKKEIQVYINEYITNPSIKNFIKIKIFVKDKIYPKWTLKELIKGEKQYYDQQFKIANFNFTTFNIEIIYKNFRASNVINFKKEVMRTDYIKVSLNTIVNCSGDISYIKLLKKFLTFIKWIYFKNKIINKQLFDNTPLLYNELYEYNESFGLEYNKNCKYKNKIDILKLKINKYNKKMEKKSDNKYQKYIDFYKNAINELDNKMNENMKKINEICKEKYEQIIIPYISHLKEYVRYN